jgi:hypothetical protein
VSTVNAPENTDRPEDPASSGIPEDPATPEVPADSGTSATPGSSIPSEDAAAADAAESSSYSADTSIYVRRGRTPTLGFWVALAIAVPAVAAVLSAPFFGFADLGGVLNYVLIVAVFVGLPLAAIICVVDAFRHRRPTDRRR